MNLINTKSVVLCLFFLLTTLPAHVSLASNQLANNNRLLNTFIAKQTATKPPAQGLQTPQQINWAALIASLKKAKIPLQLGIFSALQGKAQQININGLIGDYFSINNKAKQNVLVGLGYFIDGLEKHWFNLAYGINLFYLAHASVNGAVTQEDLFTNLAYSYSITNYPIYIASKAQIKNSSNKYNFTLDFGIGPNIINTSNFHETSIDGGITIPDSIFSGHTSTAFSVTAGVGIKLHNIFGRAPLECGYRFFYLGKGQLNKLTKEVLNTLSTGNSYANALVCSITV